MVNHSHLFSLVLTKISSHFLSYSVNCLSSLFLVFYYFHLCLHGKSEDLLSWIMGENQTLFSLWGRNLQSHKWQCRQMNISIKKTALPKALSVDLIFLPSKSLEDNVFPGTILRQQQLLPLDKLTLNDNTDVYFFSNAYPVALGCFIFFFCSFLF